jgi:hypothetical protein
MRKSYKFGISEKSMDVISEKELEDCLASHPDGFVVSGTLQEFKARENNELGIVNFRGMVFVGKYDFAEDGMPHLPSHDFHKALVLVHVSEEHRYILFIALERGEDKMKPGFGQMCTEAVKFADREMEKKRRRTQHTGAVLQLGTCVWGGAFSHVVEKITSL